MQQAQAPAPQTAATTAPTEEITVTARRIQERLQDVPISISVFTQQQLSNSNIVNASDLANVTTSLSTDRRFGEDNSSFAIRGFTQEIRTSPSVGVFFDDVVAPRGGGVGTTAGEGAGPGDFFDLQNVQVLKGPQGTLFGRNTTGGDILLVPVRPSDQFGGYVEQSAGDFDLVRTQAVLNTPISDTVRARFGFDRETRDGFEENISGIGPNALGDVNFFAVRASLDADITPQLNNYIVASYSRSQNHTTIPQIFACNQNPQLPFFGPLILGSACAQVARQEQHGFFTVDSVMPDPESLNQQWQIIDTTTFLATDDLTIKNIASFSQFRNILRSEVFGDDFPVPAIVLGKPTGVLQGTPVFPTDDNPAPGLDNSDQQTATEEFQVQGNALDNRLIYQSGVYYELSNPVRLSGSLSANESTCTSFNTIPPACTDILGQLISPSLVGLIGGAQLSQGGIDFHNLGIYEQTTYTLTDELKLTEGLRYTSDLSKGNVEQIVFNFPAPPTPVRLSCTDPTASLAQNCFKSFRQHSQAPTAVLDLDFTPFQDVLLFAKYSRGYRQGGVDPFGPVGFSTFAPEHVDAYELGGKTSFTAPVPGLGTIPGTFDFSLFYNNLFNQQLQAAFANTGSVNLAASPTTGIVNAGQSRIYGAEIDSSIRPIPDFTLAFSGAYLNSLLESEAPVVLGPNSPFNTVLFTSSVGEPLPLTPMFKYSLTGTYNVPVPQHYGKVSVGLNFESTSHQLVTAPANSPFPFINDEAILNAFANWDSIGDSPVSASFFATNLTNDRYATFIDGLFSSFGFENRTIGEPFMFGFRVRYDFGG